MCMFPAIGPNPGAARIGSRATGDGAAMDISGYPAGGGKPRLFHPEHDHPMRWNHSPVIGEIPQFFLPPAITK